MDAVVETKLAHKQIIFVGSKYFSQFYIGRDTTNPVETNIKMLYNQLHFYC